MTDTSREALMRRAVLDHLHGARLAGERWVVTTPVPPGAVLRTAAVAGLTGALLLPHIAVAGEAPVDPEAQLDPGSPIPESATARSAAPSAGRPVEPLPALPNEGGPPPEANADAPAEAPPQAVAPEEAPPQAAAAPKEAPPQAVAAPEEALPQAAAPQAPAARGTAHGVPRVQGTASVAPRPATAGQPTPATPADQPQPQPQAAPTGPVRTQTLPPPSASPGSASGPQTRPGPPPPTPAPEPLPTLRERAEDAAARPPTPERIEAWVTTVDDSLQASAPAPTVVTLPEVAPSPTMGWSYAIQPGDSLWRISEHLWADSPSDYDLDRTWRLLYEWNGDVLGPDPDLIYPGQVIQIPADAVSSTEAQ